MEKDACFPRLLSVQKDNQEALCSAENDWDDG